MITWIGLCHGIGLTDLTDEQVELYVEKFYGSMGFIEAVRAVMAEPHFLIGDPNPLAPIAEIDSEETSCRLKHTEYLLRCLWLEDKSSPVYKGLRYGFLRRLMLRHLKHQMSKMEHS